MMRLAPGSATTPYRTTANNLYAVVSGTGTTTVENERFEWRRGDVVAVPTWHMHFHRAHEAAVLFRVSDEPVMERLGFLRSEAA
jgi:gentisate 1,2-dioxygenase